MGMGNKSPGSSRMGGRTPTMLPPGGLGFLTAGPMGSGAPTNPTPPPERVSAMSGARSRFDSGAANALAQPRADLMSAGNTPLSSLQGMRGFQPRADFSSLGQSPMSSFGLGGLRRFQPRADLSSLGQSPLASFRRGGLRGFASGGMVPEPDFQGMAEVLADRGRYGDSMLMHVSPSEVQAVSQAFPGMITTNPDTGQPEAFIPQLIAGIASLLGNVGAAASAIPVVGGLAGAVPTAAANVLGGLSGMMGAAVPGLAGAKTAAQLGIAAPQAFVAPTLTGGITSGAGTSAGTAAAAKAAAAKAAAGAAGGVSLNVPTVAQGVAKSVISPPPAAVGQFPGFAGPNIVSPAVLNPGPPIPPSSPVGGPFQSIGKMASSGGDFSGMMPPVGGGGQQQQAPAPRPPMPAGLEEAAGGIFDVAKGAGSKMMEFAKDNPLETLAGGMMFADLMAQREAEQERRKADKKFAKRARASMKENAPPTSRVALDYPSVPSGRVPGSRERRYYDYVYGDGSGSGRVG
jgi:hypothetical protein